MTIADASGLPGLARTLIGRFRRSDGEHQITLNRLLLGPLMILYLQLAAPEPHGMAVLLCYVVTGVAVVPMLLAGRGISHVRRTLMLVVDLGTVSWVLHANGEWGAACYPLYLWTIFGYGFRYGLRYLYIAAAISIACFTLAMLNTPFWRELPALAGSLLFGLITLPLYAGTLIRKLSGARAEAEAANRAKSYFLASVSHELRTPLTAVIGLSEHIADTGAGAEDREMARTIVSAGRSLLSLINQLLDYSRLEAGGMTVKEAPFALMALLGEVRDLMRHAAHEKGLALTLHVRPGTPLMISGDAERLRDVLINLLGNALKFTSAGAVTIVADSQIEGGATFLRLAVQDTGIGIAEEAQAKIFGSFVQADDSIIDRFGGTGLGLAICKQLAEGMGGRIWVESVPGEGSRFVFTARVAPLAVADERPDRVLLLGGAACAASRIRAALDGAVAIDEAADIATAEAMLANGRERIVLVADRADGWPAALDAALRRGVPPVMLIDGADVDRTVERDALTTIARDADPAAIRAALAIALSQSRQPDVRPAAAPLVVEVPRRRVLVADDNPMNRKVFGMVLGRAGHVVELAENGEAALDAMKGHGFDVVLMDVNMPVMNGIEATKLYRFAALGQRRVPIIAVTADMSDENVARCLEAGMDACLGKPIEADELIALIAELTAPAGAAPPRPIPFDPSATVVPLFAGDATEAEEPALDPAALAELLELGGEGFIDELLDVYREDAAAMGARVRHAVATGDIQEFRDGTHALRSSAANIGATRLAELCRHYQRIAAPEFDDRAARHLATLEAELARVGKALDARRGEAGRSVARG